MSIFFLFILSWLRILFHFKKKHCGLLQYFPTWFLFCYSVSSHVFFKIIFVEFFYNIELVKNLALTFPTYFIFHLFSIFVLFFFSKIIFFLLFFFQNCFCRFYFFNIELVENLALYFFLKHCGLLQYFPTWFFFMVFFVFF